MWDAQSNTDSVLGKVIERIRRHNRNSFWVNPLLALESRGICPGSRKRFLLFRFFFFRCFGVASFGRTASLAFAGVLALATVVPSLASALAFARVHALAGVLICGGLIFVAHFDRNTRFGARLDCLCRHGKRTAHQAGNCCPGDHCFPCHVGSFFFLLVFAELPNGTTPSGAGQSIKKYLNFFYQATPYDVAGSDSGEMLIPRGAPGVKSKLQVGPKTDDGTLNDRFDAVLGKK